MKCIYCNSEEKITLSDIIPTALTGAKLTRRFVCDTHNKFTNDNYERDMIKQLAAYRNFIGLTERDGDPVRYYADLNIGDRTFKRVRITDNASVVSGDRIFRDTDNSGKTILAGGRDNLLKINGATENNVKTIDAKDFSIVIRDDLRELFISSQVLHAIAKICYEWHCYINDIDGFIEEKYCDIVSYILSPEDEEAPVELVVDAFTWELSDRVSRTGTNMLFEYDDYDGYTYVVFSLWNTILYKVKICKSDIKNEKETSLINIYLFHVDGTQENSVFGIVGKAHVISESPKEGLSRLCLEIRDRLNKVGQRDLSVDYINKHLDTIIKMLPRYKNGRLSIAQLLDFENKDRVIPIYIIEQLFNEKDKYQETQSFTEIMVSILNCGETYGVTEEKLKEILLRYSEMDKDGTFVVMLESAIEYFKNRFINND